MVKQNFYKNVIYGYDNYDVNYHNPQYKIWNNSRDLWNIVRKRLNFINGGRITINSIQEPLREYVNNEINNR